MHCNGYRSRQGLILYDNGNDNNDVGQQTKGIYKYMKSPRHLPPDIWQGTTLPPCQIYTEKF